MGTLRTGDTGSEVMQCWRNPASSLSLAHPEPLGLGGGRAKLLNIAAARLVSMTGGCGVPRIGVKNREGVTRVLLKGFIPQRER